MSKSGWIWPNTKSWQGRLSTWFWQRKNNDKCLNKKKKIGKFMVDCYELDLSQIQILTTFLVTRIFCSAHLCCIIESCELFYSLFKFLLALSCTLFRRLTEYRVAFVLSCLFSNIVNFASYKVFFKHSIVFFFNICAHMSNFSIFINTEIIFL